MTTRFKSNNYIIHNGTSWTDRLVGEKTTILKYYTSRRANWRLKLNTRDYSVVRTQDFVACSGNPSVIYRQERSTSRPGQPEHKLFVRRVVFKSISHCVRSRRRWCVKISLNEHYSASVILQIIYSLFRDEYHDQNERVKNAIITWWFIILFFSELNLIGCTVKSIVIR